MNCNLIQFLILLSFVIVCVYMLKSLILTIVMCSALPKFQSGRSNSPVKKIFTGNPLNTSTNCFVKQNNKTCNMPARTKGDPFAVHFRKLLINSVTQVRRVNHSVYFGCMISYDGNCKGTIGKTCMVAYNTTDVIIETAWKCNI